MKKVSQLSKAIGDQRAIVKQLQANRAAKQKTIDALLTRTGVSDGLRSQIQRLKAQGLADGRSVDTSTLEAQLATAEDERTAAVAQARDLETEIATIDEGLALATSALAELEAKGAAALTEELLAVHDSHQQRYLEAIEALRESVIGMAAAERAWRLALPNTAGVKFPGRGAQVLTDVRENGIRVPATASRLRDPAVAANYANGWQRGWFLPEWADPQTFGIGDEETAALVALIKKTGFICSEFKPAVAAPVEKMVMVRVARGVIQMSAPKLTADGVALATQATNYGPGEDVEIDERSATHLHRAGQVVIHGRGELPKPTSARKEEFTLFEAQVPPQSIHFDSARA